MSLGTVFTAQPYDQGDELDQISLTIYDEPQPQARPRVTVRGGKPHAYVPAESQRSAWVIRQEATKALRGRPPFSGPVSVAAWVYLRMPKSISKRNRDTARPTKRPDLDNYIKNLLDGLSPLWNDDSQVVVIRAEKVYGDVPRWEVFIKALD